MCKLMIILGFIGFLAVSFVCIEWITHRGMTMRESKCYGYGSFKQFLKYYELFKWERDHTFRYSHFCYGEALPPAKAYIHASIVRFNGHGMVLRFPLDFLRYKFWLWKNRIERPKVVKKRFGKEFKGD